MHADQLALQQLALQQEVQRLVDLAQAPKSNQCSFDCFVEWGVRFGPKHRPEACVVHVQRNTP